MNPTILPPAKGKKSGQTVLFSFAIVTGVEERKFLNSNRLNYA